MVIRGKRGRGVPLLFSPDMQQHMSLLLKVRANFIQENNLFLFASTKSDKPIVGYKVVQKHSKLCGAKNPQALTSTKLRKHLATLTQIFNMSQSDVEQLATFMGHTLNVHNKDYRLPDDVFQAAKIAKLLLLMERGEAGKYKGKCLEEIDLNLEENIDIEDSDEDNIRPLDVDINTQHEQFELENEQELEKEKPMMRKRELVPWSVQQKQIVKSFFADHIKQQKAPKRAECNEMVELYPDVFHNKSWTKIKVYVQNCYTKKNKDF